MRVTAVAAWIAGVCALGACYAVNPSLPHVEVPRSGSVAADHLPNGTPVWVVSYEDDRVAVFEALSTHRLAGIDWAVGWCERQRAFIDYLGASRWDDDGRYVGGPAPSDLTRYEIVNVEGDKAFVGHRIVAPRRTFTGHGPLGGTCADNGEIPHDLSTSGEYHVANFADGVSLEQAAAAEGQVVLEGYAMFDVSGPVTFCAAEFEFDVKTGECGGLLLTFYDSHSDTPRGERMVLDMRVLARIDGDVLRDAIGLPGTDVVSARP